MLNSLQKQRAADNHHMIIEFLSRKHLSEQEYYDVVVFGFLRAISMCDNLDDLHECAMAEMEKDIEEDRDAAINEMETSLNRLDAQYPDANQGMPLNEKKTRLVSVLDSVLSNHERDMISLLQQGYDRKKAAEHSNLPVEAVDICLKRARYYVSNLCCA